MTDISKIVFIVAEDDKSIHDLEPMQIGLVMRNYKGITYEVKQFTNGREALLEYLNQDAAGVQVVVVADYAMPETDGFLLYESIRMHERDSIKPYSPFIMHTAYLREEFEGKFNYADKIGPERDVTPVTHKTEFFEKEPTYMVHKPASLPHTLEYVMAKLTAKE